MALCIIPARGGSKGIPRKNIRLVAGKPLLAHTLEQALGTPSISRVVVSTDSAEIASITAQYGAEVVWRPSEISGDAAPSEAALLHTLDYLRDKEAYEPEFVVFLQATSPIRQKNDIENAVQTFRAQEADSLLSLGPLEGFVWRNEGGALTSLNYDYRHRQRRQDAPEDLIENGSIYVFKPWVLRTYHNRLGGKIVSYRMGAVESLQVDEEEDLVLVEHFIRARQPLRSVPDFSDIKLLVLDFDGVLTDNRVLLDQQGKEAVLCHRGDGMGIAALRGAGIEVRVLSKERNPVVAARCEKLKVPYDQACDDKLSALKRLAAERKLMPHQIAFMGNDVNDLAGLRWVGLPIAVADAVPEVKEVAAYVTLKKGGKGSVREVCDLILKQQEGHGKNSSASPKLFTI